jgi:hypothetical protein
MWVRPVAYPKVENLICASLTLAPVLSANVRLGWNGFQGTNTIAFYENPSIKAVKSFIGLTPA